MPQSLLSKARHLHLSRKAVAEKREKADVSITPGVQRDNESGDQSSAALDTGQPAKVNRRYLNKARSCELQKIRMSCKDAIEYTTVLLNNMTVSDHTKATMLAFLMGLKIESTRIRGLKTNAFVIDRDPLWLTRKRNYRISPTQ